MADSHGHAPRGPRRLAAALGWSLQGLKAAWWHESSFRLEVMLSAGLAPAAWWLGNGPVERVLLVGSLLLVLALELVNSAIEAVIERFGAEWHPVAGRAKDMGSAAVFVGIVNAALTWGLLALPVPAWGQ
ncbi:MAG: diacylglycerol kinase [Pseudomonadota bacterium]